MKKILILYFSGAGAAQIIAKMMYANIEYKADMTLCSFENAGDYNLNDYDALIVGTPVYHAAPSSIVMDYFAAMKPLAKEAPAFLYNTRATWSCNTNRILAKHLKARNIITIMDRDYRSPASDGSLIVPFVQRFREFDGQIASKVHRDCSSFLKLLERPRPAPGYIPHFRLSSIINAPNKLVGQLITFQIHLHKENCLRCGKCVKNCPCHARGRDTDGYPTFLSKKCDNCYRCIHHCPGKALSLSKRHAPKKQLYTGNGPGAIG